MNMKQLPRQLNLKKMQNSAVEQSDLKLTAEAVEIEDNCLSS